MLTKIMLLNEEGEFKELAAYTLDPKTALICYLEQYKNHNYNTWEYSNSKFIDQIKQLKLSKEYSYSIPMKNENIFTRVIQ